MTSIKKLEKLFKQLEGLDMLGVKVILYLITNKTSDNTLSFKIHAIDRYNNIIEEHTFIDIPSKYIDYYCNKYSVIPQIESIEEA